MKNHEWRVEKLWNLETDDLYKANLENIRKVFLNYAREKKYT